MRPEDTKRAKEIFDKFDGNFFQMQREGVYEQYKKYMISEQTELQWMKEKKNEIVEILLTCKNNKSIADAFAICGHYTVQMKDEDTLNFMLKYVNEHKADWDTNTVFRNVNAILSSICIMKDSYEKKKIIEKCILWLENVLNRDFKVSDDYKEGGDMPDYLSTTKVLTNIRNTIKYWQDKIKES